MATAAEALSARVRPAGTAAEPAPVSASVRAAALRGVRACAAPLMLVAMFDGVVGHRLLPTIVWAALLLVAGFAVAIAERVRPDPARAAWHDASGLVFMAGLELLMTAGARPAEAHAHGSSPVLVVAAGAYGLASLALAARRATWPDRISAAGMGVAMAVMATAMLG